MPFEEAKIGGELSGLFSLGANSFSSKIRLHANAPCFEKIGLSKTES